MKRRDKIKCCNIIDTAKSKFGDKIIEVSTLSQSYDIIGLQDLYLQLDTESSNLKMVSDVISSGIDLSGSHI